MKPIIAILSRNEIIDNFNLEGVHEELLIAIKKYGGIPLILVPTSKEDLYQVLDKCMGIILPGGSDERSFDYLAVEYSIKKDIPLLGICLGMQVMATYNNKDYLEENKTQIMHNSPNVNYVHDVILNKDSKLSKIFNKTKINVNSRHNLHIITSCEYKIVGKSIDGIVEAIEREDKDFNIGVQWHPESMLEYDENSNKLFESFIKICKKHSKNKYL